MIAHRIIGKVQGGPGSFSLAFEFGDTVDRTDPIAPKPVELGGDSAAIAKFRDLAHDAYANHGAALWHPGGKVSRLAFESLHFCEAVLGVFVRETGLPWRFEIETGLTGRSRGEPGTVY